MKRLLMVLVVVCLLPSFAHAQIPLPNQWFGSCGQVRIGNDARQYGQFGLWLEYTVFTMRDVNTCPITVAVDAAVPGVANSGLSDLGLFSASVTRQVQVPYPDKWESRGRHRFSIWVPSMFAPFEVSFDLPNTVGEAQIVDRREPPDPVFVCEVLEMGSWEDGKCAYPNCPIIVDSARDGYQLTSVDNGVRFDLDADGVAERVAWTRRDSDDGFLAMDRNGNGRIDDGSELFGNHTPSRPAAPDIATPNGFEALKFIETPDYGRSRQDGVIDARDAAFSRLVLWRDANHNGVSEPEELQPLTETGIQSIDTRYRNSRRVDRHGNEFRQRSTVRWSDGQLDQVFDVWLLWRH
jgi:hypothetical protein